MKRRKPLALLAVGLLGVATLMAVANALWFQVLTINADVTTSELKVGWTGFGCNNDNEPGGGFLSAGWQQQTKDVASFTSPTSLDDPEIIIVDAYPGYAFDCEVEFSNLADVPVHLERAVFLVDDLSTPQSPDFFFECVANPCKSFPNGPDLYDLNPLTPDDPFYIELVGLRLGCQYENGGGDGGSFKFGVRQPAKEQTTYVISLKLQFNQWNESGWNGVVDACGTPKNVPPTPVLPLDPTTGLPCDPVLEGIPQQPCINPTPTATPVAP
jgi:hypothetical protein